MTTHIKVSNAWKEVTQPYVKTSNAWKTVSSIYIKTGNVWKEVWTAAGPALTPTANGDSNYVFDARCYVGVSFQSSGAEYELSRTSGAATVYIGEWLASGSASSYWVSFHYTSGNPTTFDGMVNAQRYNLGTTRKFVHSVRGLVVTLTRTISGYFRFWDVASGGTHLVQTSTASWTCESEPSGGGPCPLCCFTPDTLVAMESGLEIPISEVNEGDYIMTVQGPAQVESVIVRHNVPMFKIRTEDGKEITASPDHPFVTDEGWASADPMGDYKKLGTPDKLKVGHSLFTDEGKWTKVVSIKKAHIEPVVYTFSNSLFYANGLLVY